MKVNGRSAIAVARTETKAATTAEAARPTEQQDVFSGGTPLQELQLAGSITDPKVQISGMAWHGDQLVLLPQWAKSLYVLDKGDVLGAIDGGAAPLLPRELKIGPEGFAARFPGSEGFEAIAISRDRVYLLSEARRGDEMFGYLVSGSLTAAGLELDLKTVKTLPVTGTVKNMGYEGLVLAGDRLLVLPEADTGHHVARAFDLDLEPLGELPMPRVDYRLTDSTPADADGRFWVTNYNHPGDAGMPVAPRFEALVPLRATAAGIVADGAPHHIALDLTQPARNWEAVARLDDRGFLVMTDEFPRAIFGFVAKTA